MTPRRTLPLLLPLLALLAVGAALFWPLLLGRQHLVPFHVFAGDPALLGLDESADRPDWRFFDRSPVTMFYAQKAISARCLHEGQLPLWNPYSGIGMPLMANGQSQPFAPFFLPFLSFPTPWSYSACLMAQLLFGGLGAALLLRVLGAGRWAQCLGGVLFAFNPYALDYCVYSDVWAYVWFPWAFAQAESWARGPRRPWPLAGLLALMALSGHLEVAFLGAASAFAYLGIRLAQERRARAELSSWLALPLVAAALSAFWLLPFGEYLLNVTSPRFGGNVCFPYHLSACFVVGGELFWPPVLVALAMAGLLSGPARRFRWAVLPGALWALLMLFPFPDLLQRAVTADFLSGRYARSLAWFFIATLAALGIHAIGDGALSRRAAAAAALTGAVVLAAGTTVRLPALDEAQARHWVPLQGPLLGGQWGLVLLSGCAALLLLLPSRWLAPRWRATTLGALLLASLLPYHGAFQVYWNRSRPEPAPAVQASAADRCWFPSSGYWRSLPPNLAGAFGVRDIRFSDPFVPKRLQPLVTEKEPHQDLFESWKAPVDRFLGVVTAYTLAAPEQPQGRLQLVPRRDPEAAPRALWMGRSVWAVRADQALQRALQGDTWKSAVVLEDGGGASEGAAGREASATLALEGESTLEQRWRVNAAGPGWLVVRDLYWPGWRARVDGISAEVLPADGVFRAVPLTAGSHEVRLRYRPLSFVLGICISAGSLIGVWAWLLWRRRRGARDQVTAQRGTLEESKR